MPKQSITAQKNMNSAKKFPNLLLNVSTSLRQNLHVVSLAILRLKQYLKMNHRSFGNRQKKIQGSMKKIIRNTLWVAKKLLLIKLEKQSNS